MSKKYLDYNGLLYFWQKLKAYFALKVHTHSEYENVQADWNQTTTTADDYIKNKPTIPPGSVVDSSFSTTSTNAVQNKVITLELQAVDISASWSGETATIGVTSGTGGQVSGSDTFSIPAGTEQQLIAGSSTTSKLWPATVIHSYVTGQIETAVTGAASFQGTAPTTFAPTNYKKGYYWVVGTAGTYVGETCEPGDMIFAVADYNSAYSASDFNVIQTNLDITDISNSDIDTIVAS